MATISATGFAALRLVLDYNEAEETVALRREFQELREGCKEALAEADEACPALFASVGDLFTHRRHDNMGDELDTEVFEYQGRTLGSGKPPQATPAGWLVFKHVQGHWGIEGGFGAVNRGVRDAIRAWPQCDYRLYDEEGQYEYGVFRLPPSMCYGFRVPDSNYDEDSDEDEEDEDEENEEEEDDE